MNAMLTFPIATVFPATTPVSQIAPLSAPTTDEDRQALITKHLPLVRSVAGKLRVYADTSAVVDFEDLVGYGVEGLIHAADTYSPARNTAFSTWAVLHIRTTIQDALRGLDPVPRSARAKNRLIEQKTQELAQEHGQWPDSCQVATALGSPVAEVRMARQIATRREVSLDAVDAATGEDVHQSWMTALADENPAGSPEAVAEVAATSAVLRGAVAALPEREATLVRMYYIEGQSIRTIGTHFGVSESRVSQLHSRALRLLREVYTAAIDDRPRQAA